MNVLITLLHRELTLAEAQLGELDGPLAVIAKRHVKEAWRCVDTLRRLEERKHVLGNREDTAAGIAREGKW